MQSAIKMMILDERKVLGVLLRGTRIEITTAEDIYKVGLYLEAMEEKK